MWPRLPSSCVCPESQEVETDDEGWRREWNPEDPDSNDVRWMEQYEDSEEHCNELTASAEGAEKGRGKGGRDALTEGRGRSGEVAEETRRNEMREMWARERMRLERERPVDRRGDEGETFASSTPAY